MTVVIAGVLVGCGGSDTDDGGLPTLEGEATVETVKACLEEQAPGPFEVDRSDPTAPRIDGYLRKDTALASYAQITIFSNPADATAQAEYEADLYKDLEGATQSVVANADNVLLRYELDIPKADLALLDSCTTPG
jgi:hypothetical protein